MWIAEEKKYVRKSLKTRDLKTAIERGKTLYLEMHGDVRSGKKIFGITVGELVEQYVEWRREDASFLVTLPKTRRPVSPLNVYIAPAPVKRFEGTLR